MVLVTGLAMTRERERGIMLKGNGQFDLGPQLWPILALVRVAIGLGLTLYRRTLD